MIKETNNIRRLSGQLPECLSHGSVETPLSDVVIIGGPSDPPVSAQNRSVEQVPFSVKGFNRINNRLVDADLVIYWPDWRIFGEFQCLDDLLDCDPAAYQFLLDNNPPLCPKENRIRRLSRQELLDVIRAKDFFKGNNENDMIIREWTLGIIAHAMKGAFNVAASGHAIVLVVPSDFPAWGDRNCISGPGPTAALPVDEHNYFDWFSPRLCVAADRGIKLTQWTPHLESSLFFEALVKAHTASIDSWPLAFSVDMSPARPDESCGQLPEDEVNRSISFFPGAKGWSSAAKSLIFTVRSGGVIVMPPPRSLNALLECLPPPQSFRKESGDSKTAEGNEAIMLDANASTEVDAKETVVSDVEVLTSTENQAKGSMPKPKQLTFTTELCAPSPGHRGWFIKIEDEKIMFGKRAFLTILAYTVASEYPPGRNHINPALPKIGGAKGTALKDIIMKANAKSCRALAQKINDKFGDRPPILKTVPYDPGKQGATIYRLNTEAYTTNFKMLVPFSKLDPDIKSILKLRFTQSK